MNTFKWGHGIIIDVNPPIHYKVFVSPHKQKYFLQKDSNGSCPFFFSPKIRKIIDEMRLKSISIALFRSIFELHFIYVVESVFIVFGKEKGMMCIHIFMVCVYTIK